MLWFGLILAALGGLLVFLSKRAADKVLHMRSTETTRLGDLLETVRQVRAELGGGASELREYVELKGTLRCDRPFRAELSGQPAAIVETRVVREAEELREHRDSNGRVTTRWETRSDTVHANHLEVPFVLDDGTGQVEVRPAGASVTLQQVVDRFEQPGAVEAGGALRLGAFQIGLHGGMGGGFAMTSGNFRVRGYRFQESILPIGARVYALGEVSDTSDGLALGKPASGDKPFLLSVKSEEELVASGQKSAKWLKISGFASAVLGVVLALVGVVQRLA